jgi:zinc protease
MSQFKNDNKAQDYIYIKKLVYILLPIFILVLIVLAISFELVPSSDFDDRSVEITKRLESLHKEKGYSDFSKKVVEVVSDEGVKAWLIEEHSNPIVAINVSFSTGSVNDDASKIGLTNMVSGLLDEGSGDMGSEEFQDLLKDKAIRLSFSGAQEEFTAGLQTLSENKTLAVSLLRQALLNPRFDDEPVERIRRQILTSIKMIDENPSKRASLALMKHIFSNHPYSWDVMGAKNTVKNITKADLKNYVKHRFAKDNVFVGVAGDITPDELKKLLDDLFVGFPEKSNHKKLGDITPNFDGKDVHINMNIPQTIALFAQKGVSRNDEDFYPLYIMNYVLGGGSFSSRLMQEIRVKNGFAYGVSSYLSLLEKAPMLSGYVATNAKDFEKSKEIILQQWQEMKKNGVTAEELHNAQKYLTGSFPLRFNSTFGISAMLTSMQYHKLGIDFLETRNATVRAVSVGDIKKVAEKYLSPESLVFSVVGKTKNIEK